MPTKTIDRDVLDVLSEADIDGVNVVLTGTLDRKLYTKVAKVLKGLGGKWNRKAKATVFAEEAWPLIADAVATGQYVSLTDAKKLFQAFWTPESLASEICDDLDIAEGMKFLEPSAGCGRIAEEARKRGAKVTCCEVQDQWIQYLSKEKFPVLGVDFLTVHPQPVYDRIGMNPPFTRSQDILHVRHAHQLLTPGGRMVAIMSPGWTFRQDKKAVQFREWLDEKDHSWEEIPEGTFKESGTMVRTVKVIIEA